MIEKEKKEKNKKREERENRENREHRERRENRGNRRDLMRTVAAVAVCKLSRKVLHRIGRGGTALPGKAAMWLKKDLLAEVSRNVESIVVTGTNGKTTTSAMLESAMKHAGRETILNRSGANLLSGVTAELAACADWRGRASRPYAVIECDEGALHQVVPLLRPKVIVVTNLFRDQLDRYGEVMHTLEAIRRGIREMPEAILCLNADDSLVASLALDLPNPVIWFGLEDVVGTAAAASGSAPDFEKNFEAGSLTEPAAGDSAAETAAAGSAAGDSAAETAAAGSAAETAAAGSAAGSDRGGSDGVNGDAQISDARYCIRCGAEYEYDFHTYAHLGAFRCPACGYMRHQPDVAVTSIDRMDFTGTQVHMRFEKGKAFYGSVSGVTAESPAQPPAEINENTKETAGESISVEIAAPAVYNIYNAAAAACAARAAGIGREAILEALGETAGSFGRMETFDLGGTHAQMILVKNPAGCNQALEYLCGLGKPYNAILCLNDEDADGHDISWIWDVDYEKLCEDEALRRIYVWGRRAEDLQLRLKYAGAEESRIRLVRDKEKLIPIIRGSKVPVFILPNYTTMLAVRELLQKETGKAEFWKGNA